MTAPPRAPSPARPLHPFTAFLHGINLGRRRVTIDRLAACGAAPKLTDAAACIVSGNVIFSRQSAAVAPITATTGQHFRTALGHEVATFLRTRAELAAIAPCQPFAPADLANPANTVHVGFFAAAPAPARRRGLLARSSPTDGIPVEGRKYFWP